ncbi:MAG: hypothetical protein ACUVUG_05705, partial [Candidatus Aminicenantia bacterium]
LIGLMEDSKEEFCIETQKKDFEFGVRNIIKGKPNRGRIKIFFHKENKPLIFFYKVSTVPHSIDRFSYGVVTPSLESNPEEIKEWLDFLVSGLSPERRPKDLKRSFPFDIPE